MKWLCNLDVAGVLTGYTHVADADVPAGGVAFDGQPDLVPGQYRWNGEAFEPVVLAGKWHAPDGPDAWYAMFRLVAYLHTVPQINLPAPVKQWAKYYYNAFKRPGDTDPGV